MAFFGAKCAGAVSFFAADSAGDPALFEKQALLQSIRLEKKRIANDYKSADSRLFNLVDSITGFINTQPVSPAKKNLYLNLLQTFLVNINRHYSDSYLKSGTYLAVLCYYPEMIEWDQKDDLSKNIKRYPAFSIKATRLIPGDTAAEDFLTDYLSDHPDDIFRYAEEFDDRKFALRILEKATKLAPESAKRYYTTSNVVGDLLRTSKNLFVKKSLEIYNRFGLKSHAYLLLDDIIKNDMSLRAADSIGNNPEQLFDLLVHLSTKYESDITYSIYRYMDEYCVETMRRIQEESLNPGYTYQTFAGMSPDEMFMLLSYGYKETTIKTFNDLLEILKKKSNGVPVSSVMIATMDREKLKELVIQCDKDKMLEELLGLTDNEKKEYLLSLTALPEKENLMPPFNTFTKEVEVIATGDLDKNVNNIPRARPPKAVAPDILMTEPGKPQVEPTPETKHIIPVPELSAREPASLRETGNEPEKALVPDMIMVPNKAVIPVEKIERRPAIDVVTLNPEMLSFISANTQLTVSNPEMVKGITRVYFAPEIVEPVKIVLDNKTRTLVSLKKNILQTIQTIPSFINKEYAEEILMYAAVKEPDELFKKINSFKSETFCMQVLEVCAMNAPVSLKRYLYNPMEPVNYTLHYSTNPVVKKIMEINTGLGYQSKPLLLLDDIVKSRRQLKDAIAISADPGQLFSAVVKIISRPEYLGKYSIDHEMRDYSLRFIREINDNLATGSPQPFYSVEGFGSAELYFLMLYGRDEVFTSTFNGLFNRFMQKLPDDNGDAFLRSVSNNQFRDFLSLCSNYGTLEEFLTKFSPEARKKLLISYISALETEKDDLSTIVLIAEAISNLVDNQLLSILESNIRKEYERVKASNDQIGISIYGVLSSMISGNARVDAGWYKKVSQQFRISPVNTLTLAALFNKKTACIEQMYFYDDEDGRSSFINFMNTYRNQVAWGVEDRSSYVRIFSKSEMPVEIFANKPGFEENGVNAIEAYLHEKNLIPTVVVHRGHSFHTESTLEKINPSARLIFLGSCGGFYKISMAMESAPDAHIISTKQVGTTTINDIMLFALNENIRTGKDIEWNEFWDEMRDKLGNNQYFGDYVPPHKNLETIFIRAYYKILGV